MQDEIYASIGVALHGNAVAARLQGYRALGIKPSFWLTDRDRHSRVSAIAARVPSIQDPKQARRVKHLNPVNARIFSVLKPHHPPETPGEVDHQLTTARSDAYLPHEGARGSAQHQHQQSHYASHWWMLRIHPQVGQQISVTCISQR
jgi:hypothetical protein